MTARSNPPRVSIIIPVRNEDQTIGAAIESCLDQDYDGEVEIVVSDAMSDDATRAIVSRYQDSDGVKLIDNPARSTPAGLNAAISASSGDVIVRCDGHSVLPQDYVADAVRLLSETGAGNVGGVQRAVGKTLMQRGIAAAMTSPLGVGNARFHRGGAAGPVDTVFLGVFTREAIERTQGYDETLIRNQDYELNIRLREAGYTVWFDPILEVEYSPRSSLGALWRQYNQYGRWKRRVLLMHPRSLKPRQAAPPLVVITLAVSTVALTTRLRSFGAAAIVGYSSALAVSGIIDAVRTRDKAALLSAPAMGVMHIAWGIGFLAGRTQGKSLKQSPATHSPVR